MHDAFGFKFAVEFTPESFLNDFDFFVFVEGDCFFLRSNDHESFVAEDFDEPGSEVVAVESIPCFECFYEGGLHEVFGFFLSAAEAPGNAKEDSQFAGDFSFEVPGIFACE